MQPAGEPRAAATPADQADAPLPPPAFESALPNGVQAIVFKPFTGDLDEMVKRRPDLSGQEVFVRKGGTYHQSVLALNDTLRAQGKPPVLVRFAPDNLEDDDLLEMVNAGLVPITIVDSYLADFWKKIFTNLRVHDTVTVRTGGELAVAIRKNSPQLAAAFNQFLAKNGLGTAFGNIMEKRIWAAPR